MNNETKSNGNGKKPYGIELSERPKLGFEGKTTFTYVDNGTEPITAASFGTRVNEIFRALFKDYVGCYFDTSNNNFTYSLFFDHENHDEGDIVGVVNSGRKGTNTGNAALDLVYKVQNRRINGDKYVPTDEFIDVVKPLLSPVAYNNGKPNWNNIINDYSENQNFYQRGSFYSPVMSRVKFIDVNKLWKYVQGKQDDNGNNVEWIVNPVHPYNFPQYRNIPYQSLKPDHWHFSVTAINTDTAENTLKIFGISGNESQIIR
jgi:hypothetical protein